jgi:phosphoglycolate phosphatase
MCVPASSCLNIGDTVVDIPTGKNAGTQTMGVLFGFNEEKELKLGEQILY